MLISLLLLLTVCAQAQESVIDTAQESVIDTTLVSTGDTVQEYGVLLQARGREMTGVCVMESSADGGVVGTLITEMGVKIFDFTYSNGKAKVLNVIAPMNKWYIRRVLRKDMKFFVERAREQESDGSGERWSDGARTFERLADGSLKVSNNRYKIYYTFTPMGDKQ